MPHHGLREVSLPAGKERARSQEAPEDDHRKEVKFRINVDDHDYETKKNHVLRFLDEGDKVKATIFFRGREMTRTNLGRQILERLIKDVEDKSIVEFRPRQEGNTLHAILAPKKDAGHKPQAAPPAPDRVKQA